MKKYMLFFIISFAALQLSAQTITDQDINVGDVFIIGAQPSNGYQYINVPKENIIIKRGGIASYDSLAQTPVEVTSVSADTNGKTLITIKRRDYGRFFGSHTYLTVAMEGAMNEGELLKE